MSTRRTKCCPMCKGRGEVAVPKHVLAQEAKDEERIFTHSSPGEYDRLAEKFRGYLERHKLWDHSERHYIAIKLLRVRRTIGLRFTACASDRDFRARRWIPNEIFNELHTGVGVLLSGEQAGYTAQQMYRRWYSKDLPENTYRA